MAPAEHPSFLALDRAADGAPTPAVSGHLETCAECRAHVQAVRRAPPLPDWLPPAPRRRPRALWAVPVAAAAALALLLLRPTAPPEPAAYIGTKGTASAVVFVRRGDRVQRWSGAPLRAGDALRLGVHLPRRTHVSVYGAAGAHRGRRIFAAWLEPGSPTLIDRAWQLDDAPGPERLWIVSGAPDAPPQLTMAGLRWLDLRPQTQVEAVEITKEPRR